ncbi:hypothetical protein NDU88_006036 [Pleurodeles waltl]|uniref:25S rRNA (uridine-N(3))-methyltransferase BMT5-like domain-containing protein n=1 Tax=Pleurodeles waltl TaxID=8319 RepID=A0AAV7UNU1_PLEWA|nr:hypothetical protein NDU88_006036 [Pleurodeles waltl]
MRCFIDEAVGDAGHRRGLQILEHHCSRSRWILKLHHIHLPTNSSGTILYIVHTSCRTAAALSSRAPNLNYDARDLNFFLRYWCHEETCITATCFESEEVITQQACARENVQHLRENGAQIYFQVDCTKLKEFFATAKNRFDQIVFNFPHCGKKAGVRKNRELLEKFFRSCAEVLTDDGEVHVSLCTGQGGTPADHPIREWHNSWQVTAMAARSGLILSNVKPFKADLYSEYKCTGYRSQEKPFHFEDALIHIFTRSLPLESSEPTDVAGKLVNRDVPFLMPDVLLDKISRNILDINHHPVRTFNEQLITAISSAFPLQKLPKKGVYA